MFPLPLFLYTSVYRPCLNTQSTDSVYLKQYSYSLRERDGICPRELFLFDLAEEIRKWNKLGDTIIVMGDFNEDVRSQTMKDWKDKVGLIDMMLDRVEQDGVPLHTYQQGKFPIDTILCTAGVEVYKAGYMPFGEGAGITGHCLWIFRLHHVLG